MECGQNIIEISGFRNIGTLRFMRGVSEEKDWNAWTGNSIEINIRVTIEGHRGMYPAHMSLNNKK